MLSKKHDWRDTEPALAAPFKCNSHRTKWLVVSLNSCKKGFDQFEGLPRELEEMRAFPDPVAVNLVEMEGQMLRWPHAKEPDWAGRSSPGILPAGLFCTHARSKPLPALLCSPLLGFRPFCLDLQPLHLLAKLLCPPSGGCGLKDSTSLVRTFQSVF